ncbi:MAG: hypothetical protein JXA10_13170 [Anaerolineae bacterium]|nr:hypothetical protein [Anaerolineae bacterium]
MTEQELQQVMIRYRPLGLEKGAEFLLNTADMLRLVDDLQQVGAVFLGGTSWKYIKPGDNDWIMEDIEHEFDVDESVLGQSDSSAITAEQVKSAILNLPDTVDFVTIYMDVPVSWDYFGDGK